MVHEPWGYGDRWFDRLAARRRPGTMIVGIGIILIASLAGLTAR